MKQRGMGLHGHCIRVLGSVQMDRTRAIALPPPRSMEIPARRLDFSRRTRRQSMDRLKSSILKRSGVSL
jgi:hypothetical protein